MQVDDHTDEQQRRKRLNLPDCLDYCVARSAIFFRKVEIRQTRGEELVMLLSVLEEMWAGRRLVMGPAAAQCRNTPTNSSGGGNTSGGRRPGKKRGKQPAVLQLGGPVSAEGVTRVGVGERQIIC